MTAWVLLFTFGANTFGLPLAPAMAYETNAQYVFATQVKQVLQELPESWGAVEELFLPETQAAPARFLIHIEDAHANPEAQRNIRRLLHFLNERLGMKAVALEAAAGDIHPEYLEVFRGFPEVNRSVAELLTDMGELTGAELYAFERPAGVTFQGAEHAALYRANLRCFRRLLAEGPEIEKLLARLSSELRLLASRLAGKEFRAFLAEKEARKTRGLLSPGSVTWLAKLAKAKLRIDLSDRLAQIRYPNLTRLVFLTEATHQWKGKALVKEWGEVRAKLSRLLTDARGQDILRRLETFDPEQTVARQGEGSDASASYTAREIFEDLYDATEGRFDFQPYRHFLQYTATVIVREEIDAQGLFHEIAAMESRIEKKIARTAAEKEIAELIRIQDSLDRLLRLQMTRQEYERYQRFPHASHPASVLNRLRALAQGEGTRFLIDGLWSKNLRRYQQQAEIFYFGAEKRERTVLSNTLAWLESQKEQKGVIVMGGFHTEGLRSLMREGSVAFAVIRPRIPAGSAQPDLYKQVMLDGHVSWNGDASELIFQKPDLRKNFIGDALFTMNAAYDAIRGRSHVRAAGRTLSLPKRVAVLWSAVNHPRIDQALRAELASRAQGADGEAIRKIKAASLAEHPLLRVIGAQASASLEQAASLGAARPSGEKAPSLGSPLATLRDQIQSVETFINQSPIQVSDAEEPGGVAYRSPLTPEEYQEVMDLLARTKALETPAKRALLYYLLRTQALPILQGERIVFRTRDGKPIAHVHINENLELVLDHPELEQGIRTIMDFAVYDDIDENLAPRERKLPKETVDPLHHLIMYGANVNLITANESKKAYKRLDQFHPGEVAGFSVFADGAANRYHIPPGQTKPTAIPDYRERTGAAISAEEAAVVEREIFHEFSAFWKPFFIALSRRLNAHLAPKNFPSPDDTTGMRAFFDHLAADLGAGYEHLRAPDVEQMAKTLLGTEADFAALMTRLVAIGRIKNEGEQKSKLDELLTAYQSHAPPGEKERHHFRFYQVFSVTEMLRILSSPAAELSDIDKKQQKDIIESFITLDTGGLPKKDGAMTMIFREGVQIAFKAIRPRSVRNAYVSYFLAKKDQASSAHPFLNTLRLSPGGSTTIDVLRQGISKANPIKYAVETEGRKPASILFTGDEVRVVGQPRETAGVDQAVADLTNQTEYHDLLFVSTATQPIHEETPRAFATVNTPLTAGKHGPEANGIVHATVVEKGIERQIARLLADPESPVQSAVEVLRDVLETPPFALTWDTLRNREGSPFSAPNVEATVQFFEEMIPADTPDKIEKRAALAILLSKKANLVRAGDSWTFRDETNEPLHGITITPAGELLVDARLIEAVRVMNTGAILADIEKNTVPFNEEITPEMAETVQTLLAYGVRYHSITQNEAQRQAGPVTAHLHPHLLDTYGMYANGGGVFVTWSHDGTVHHDPDYEGETAIPDANADALTGQALAPLLALWEGVLQTLRASIPSDVAVKLQPLVLRAGLTESAAERQRIQELLRKKETAQALKELAETLRRRRDPILRRLSHPRNQGVVGPIGALSPLLPEDYNVLWELTENMRKSILPQILEILESRPDTASDESVEHLIKIVNALVMPAEEIQRLKESEFEELKRRQTWPFLDVRRTAGVPGQVLQVTLKPILPESARVFLSELSERAVEGLHLSTDIQVARRGVGSIDHQRSEMTKARAAEHLAQVRGLGDPGHPHRGLIFVTDDDMGYAGSGTAFLEVPGITVISTEDTVQTRKYPDSRANVYWSNDIDDEGQLLGTEVIANQRLNEILIRLYEEELFGLMRGEKEAPTPVLERFRAQYTEPASHFASWQALETQIQADRLDAALRVVPETVEKGDRAEFFRLYLHYPEDVRSVLLWTIHPEAPSRLHEGRFFRDDLRNFLRPILAEAQVHKHPFWTNQAAYLLGELGEPDVDIPILLKVLDEELAKTGIYFNYRTVGYLIQALAKLSRQREGAVREVRTSVYETQKGVSERNRRAVIEKLTQIAEDNEARDKPGYYRNRVKAIYELRHYVVKNNGEEFQDEVYEALTRIVREKDPNKQAHASTHLSVGQSGSPVRDLRYSAAITLYLLRRERIGHRLDAFVEKLAEAGDQPSAQLLEIRPGVTSLSQYFADLEWKQPFTEAVLLLLGRYYGPGGSREKAEILLAQILNLLNDTMLPDEDRLSLLPLLDHENFLHWLAVEDTMMEYLPGIGSRTIEIANNLAALYMRTQVEALRDTEPHLAEVYPILDGMYRELAAASRYSREPRGLQLSHHRNTLKLLRFLAGVRSRFWTHDGMRQEFLKTRDLDGLRKVMKRAVVIGNGGGGTEFMMRVLAELSGRPELVSRFEERLRDQGITQAIRIDHRLFPIAYFLATIDNGGATRTDIANLLMQWGIVTIPPGDFMKGLSAALALWKAAILNKRVPEDQTEFYEGAGFIDILRKGVNLVQDEGLIGEARDIWREERKKELGRYPNSDEEARDFNASLETLIRVARELDQTLIRPDEHPQPRNLSGASLRNLAFNSFLVASRGYRKNLIDSYGIEAGIRMFMEWAAVNYLATPLHPSGTVMSFEDQYGYVNEEQDEFSHTPPQRFQKIVRTKYIFEPIVLITPNLEFYREAPLVVVGPGSPETSTGPQLQDPRIVQALQANGAGTVLIMNPIRDEETAYLDANEFLHIFRRNIAAAVGGDQFTLAEFFHAIVYHDWESLLHSRKELEKFLAVLAEPLKPAEEKPENTQIKSWKLQYQAIRHLFYDQHRISERAYMERLRELWFEIMNYRPSGLWGPIIVNPSLLATTKLNYWSGARRDDRTGMQLPGNLVTPLEIAEDTRRGRHAPLLVRVQFDPGKVAELLARGLAGEILDKMVDIYMESVGLAKPAAQTPAPQPPLSGPTATGSSLGTSPSTPELSRAEIIPMQPYLSPLEKRNAISRAIQAAKVFAAGFVNFRKLAARISSTATSVMQAFRLSEKRGWPAQNIPFEAIQFNLRRVRPLVLEHVNKTVPESRPYDGNVTMALSENVVKQLDSTPFIETAVRENDALALVWDHEANQNVVPLKIQTLITHVQKLRSRGFRISARAVPAKVAKTQLADFARDVKIEKGFSIVSDDAEDVSFETPLAMERIKLKEAAVGKFSRSEIIALIRELYDEDITLRTKRFQAARFEFDEETQTWTVGEGFATLVRELALDKIAQENFAQAA
jgi:hypothetical protein